MIVEINVHLHYAISKPTNLLFQIEAANQLDQIVETNDLDIAEGENFTRITGDEGVGTRLWLNAKTNFICNYSARVEVRRQEVVLGDLNTVQLYNLPAETIRYLMPSRYCPSDEFQNFVSHQFPQENGGAKIEAMRNWVHSNIAYVSGSSHGQTTAADTFIQRQGVCRDFAHVLICFARAAGIPARYVSVYSPLANPQDFHAVAEVYLDGGWHIVDPTDMAKPASTVRIGVGQDSADVSFLMSYGNIGFVAQRVNVSTR